MGMTMRYFSYILARDYGFAPNPFGGFCTLATCKPRIRKSVVVGDWVLGTGSATVHGSDRLVFAMCVTEKSTFQEYWTDPRFVWKRPVMNGSLLRMYGDNIYYRKKHHWHQIDSHHSKEDGTPNVNTVKRDTSCIYVLVSDHFFYFGRKSIRIPIRFRREGARNICQRGQGHRCNFPHGFAESFVEWLSETYDNGYHGDPAWFTHFARYDGGS